jgi:hypothetical protein
MGILDELTGRLELGLRKYNHGVRTDDDTRDWGTPVNSWLRMAREEFLDAMIYVAADYIRKSGLKRDESEEDDNKLIMRVIDLYNDIDSPKHKMLLWNLFNMLNTITSWDESP